MSRSVRRRAVGPLLIGGAGVAYLIWILRWLDGQFVAGAFAYHDLTLISDFFSNGLVHGRPFWVTDAAASHLATHFTPSLLLWLPAFWLFDTQFALLAIGATTVTLAIVVITSELWRCLDEAGVAAAGASVLTASAFVAFAFNDYTLRVLSSAHFEPLVLLPAVLLLVGLRRGWRSAWLGGWLLATLGVRQDVGVFVVALLAGCLVAPRAWGRPPRRTIAALAGVCLVYVAAAVLVILPWFGNRGDTRFWRSWGPTWPAVITAWATEPARVVRAVAESEFGAWTGELLYLPAVNVVAWAFNQMPAVLFYTADTPDKRFLWYYNSSFMLPGFMLGFVFAILHLMTAMDRATTGRATLRRVGIAALSIWCAAAALLTVGRMVQGPAGPASPRGLARTNPFVRPPLSDLVACRDVRSISADFRTIVFAPLGLDKYLHANARRADLVVIRRGLDPGTPAYVEPASLASALTVEGRYRLAGSRDDFDYYLSPRVTGCP